MKRFDEQAVRVSGSQGPLIGVFRSSPIPTGPVALIVAGQPQTRYGAHRMFRQLARRLADRGTCSLRLDCAGWGDSPGERGTFEASVPDIVAAMLHLAREHPGRALAIIGLCDGASAAILAAGARGTGEDFQRIAAIALINPWVRSERTQAQAMVRNYYARRVLSPAFWWKLLRGQVAWRQSVAESSRHLGTALGGGGGTPAEAEATLPDKLLDALGRFDKRVLTVLSGDDLTAAETEALMRSDSRWYKRLERQEEILRVPGADHTFSDPGHWAQACDWLSDRFSTHT